MPKKDKKPVVQPSSYAFAQQYNSACHIMNFMNLDILQQLRKEAGENIDLQQAATYRTRREWFPLTTRALVSWHKALNDLHEKNGAFKKYAEQQIRDGILNGRLVDENGKRVDDVFNPITQKVRMLLTPFNFTDATRMPLELALDHQAEAYPIIPLFMQDGKAMAFDPIVNDYVELPEVTNPADIQEKKWDVALVRVPDKPDTLIIAEEAEVESEQAPLIAQNTQPSTMARAAAALGAAVASASESIEGAVGALLPASNLETDPALFQGDLQKFLEMFPGAPSHIPQYRYYKLNDAQKNLLQLPNNAYCTRYNNDVLGFDYAFAYRYLPQIAEQHTYYMSSLNQLTLFGLGLDQNLDPITQTHPLYEAYQEFRAAMADYPDNPWQNDNFVKENFMEYHIAMLLRDDPELRQQMIDTVEVLFPSWTLRQEMDQLQYQNPDGSIEPASRHTQHLLGSDPYLAYCFMQSLRFVWASAQSKEAYTSVMELDPNTAQLLRLPGAPGPTQIIKRAEKEVNGSSFLDVWQTLRERLESDPSIPKELASFSSHGVLMSFSDDLKKLQMDNGVRKPDVMDKLGFALIDSYYGSGLKPMYRYENGKPVSDVDAKKGTRILEKRVKNRVKNGNITRAVELIQQEPTFQEVTRKGSNLLFWAAKEGHIEIINALLAKKAKVNIKDENKKTPLMHLIENHHAAGAQILIEHNADINAVDAKGNTPLSLALQHKEHAIALALIEKGADLSIANLAELAAIGGNKDVAEALIQNGVNLYIKKGKDPSPLSVALFHGNNDVALQALRSMVDYANNNVELRGANPDKSAPFRQVIKAGGLSQKEVYMLLFLALKNDDHQSALSLIDALDDIPHGLVWLAAAYKNNEAVLAMLNKRITVIPAGAEELYNERELWYSKQSLMTAAAHGCNAAVATALIRHGENVNDDTDYEYTPLLAAGIDNNHEFMQVLLQHGADPLQKHRGSSPLPRTATNIPGRPECITLLVEAIKDKDKRQQQLDAALFHASTWYSTKPEIIELLLKHGANVHYQDPRGVSVLLNAMEEAKITTAEALIKAGADVNLPDKAGRTPLMMAARQGNLEVVELLIKHGAKIAAVDNKGKSALDHAKSRQRNEVVELFENKHRTKQRVKVRVRRDEVGKERGKVVSFRNKAPKPVPGAETQRDSPKTSPRK